MERRLTSNSQFTLSETSETSQPEETLNMIADMREQLQLWQQDESQIEWNTLGAPPPRAPINETLEEPPNPVASELPEHDFDLEVDHIINGDLNYPTSNPDFRPPPGHQPSAPATPVPATQRLPQPSSPISGFNSSPILPARPLSPERVIYDSDGCGQPRDNRGHYHSVVHSPGRMEELRLLRSETYTPQPAFRTRAEGNGLALEEPPPAPSPIDGIYSGVDDTAEPSPGTPAGAPRPFSSSRQAANTGDNASHMSNPGNQYRNQYEPDLQPPPIPDCSLALETFLLRIDRDKGTNFYRAIAYFDDSDITMCNINRIDFDDHIDCPLADVEIQKLLEMHYAYMQGRSDYHHGI